jgi:3-hydroxybutyryl-CoA dehydrogenase
MTPDNNKENNNKHVVAVLGAGTIGASWAALFLASGYDVDLYDPSIDSRAFVNDYIDNAWPDLQSLSIAKSEQRPEIKFYDTPEECVKRAIFIQESVPEQLAIKHELFQRIEPYIRSDAIIASSASGLLVKDMQAGWKKPGRFILGHPFNPPHLIPLVELLGNEDTDSNVLEQAEAFYNSCSKTTIRINKEVPGHVANRLQAALWKEAVHLVNEGVASLADVDTAISAGPGLRWAVMGPNMLFDLGSGGHGIDVFCERLGPSFQQWWDDLGNPKLTPQVIEKLVSGLKEAQNGKDFNTLSFERDQKIIAISNAINDIDKQERCASTSRQRLKTAR